MKNEIKRIKIVRQKEREKGIDNMITQIDERIKIRVGEERSHLHMAVESESEHITLAQIHSNHRLGRLNLPNLYNPVSICCNQFWTCIYSFY